MSLSGSIKPGAIGDLFRTLARSKRGVTLILHNGNQFAHAEFDGGELVSVVLDEKQGEEAFETLQAWEEGIYTIIKHQDKNTPTYAHSVLVGHLSPIHKELDPWLTEHGFQTTLVPYMQQAQEIVSFLSPEVVFIACPEGATGKSCHELKQEFGSLYDPPPMVLLLGNEEGTCPMTGEPCEDTRFSLGHIKHQLAQRWPKVLQGPPPRPSGAFAPVKTDDGESVAADNGNGNGASTMASSASDVAVVAPTAVHEEHRSNKTILIVALLGLVVAGVALFLALGGKDKKEDTGADNTTGQTKKTSQQAAATDPKTPTKVAHPSTKSATPAATADAMPTPAKDAGVSKPDAQVSKADAGTVASVTAEPAKAPPPKKSPVYRRRYRVRKGVLVVSCNQTATVSVDGSSKGKTPLKVALSPGDYTVVVSSIKNPGAKQTSSVRIRARQSTRLSVAFAAPAKRPDPPPKPKPKAPKPKPATKKPGGNQIPSDNIDPWAR